MEIKLAVLRVFLSLFLAFYSFLFIVLFVLFRGGVFLKKIIIIVIVALLLGGGGFIGWKFLAPEKEEGKEKETKVDLEALVETKIDMPQISTNLSVPGSYIVITLSAQASDVEAKTEFETRLAEMQSVAITQLNSLSIEEVQGGKGLTELIQLLKIEFNKILTHGEITEVFVTEYKIQG